MANSKESLLLKMKGRSTTWGWGAIVSFNRAKVNLLLAQQHIARFSTDSFLPALRGDIALEGSERLELSNMILSAPRLSFESASLKDSRARLHMDIVGGTVTRTSHDPGSPSRVLSSFNISEQHGYVLDADIELRKVVGGISKESEVILDISKATAFTSNLIDDGITPTLIGDFVKKKFEELPAELQTYSLGLLEFNADDLLAPKDFYILTQAAPEGNNIKSDSYGDGAVVLFVRTKNNFYNGILPSGDEGSEDAFPYLIPDDKVPGEDRSLYSGSLLISRQAVIFWFMVPYLKTHIGRGVNFEERDDSDISGDYKLQAMSGAYAAAPIDVVYNSSPHHYHFIKNDLTFPFRDSLSMVIRDDCRLALEWHGVRIEKFHFWDDVSGWWDEHKDVDVEFTYDLSIIFDTYLDANANTISWVRSSASTQSASTRIIDAPLDVYAYLATRTHEVLRDIMGDIFNLFLSMDIPEINFFAINHLLFPEHNALILKEAWLPGDLAMFGEVDPALTSFSLKPLYTTVKAGNTVQFEIVELRYRASAAGITWGVRNIDGSRSQGEVTQSGLYSAPSLGQLEDTSTRNIVTATFTDARTLQTRTASAMVVVVANAMAISPAMHAIDLRYTHREVTFRASTLSGNPLRWTPLSINQGTLVANGNEATYTPPVNAPAERFTAVTIEVTDTGNQEKCVGVVLLINGVLPIDVKPAFHPGLAPSASVHLSLAGGLESVQNLTWSVPVGNGRVDATGKFTAPDIISFPYSVVQCSYFDGIGTQSGYCVLHLSEIAPRPTWETLSDFTIKEESGSAMLFANGLQQVQVRVTVKVFNDKDEQVGLSPTELNSMRLITRDGDYLPYVMESGVPEDENEDAPEFRRWGVNRKHNRNYRFYPASGASVRAPDDDWKFLWIQTRGVTPQRIAVELTRADNVQFKSTDKDGSEEKHNIIRITPVEPPTYNREAYTFTSERIVGRPDNEVELNSVDYYILRFNESVQNIKFVSIEFEGPTSMVQWESRQYAEEVGSYTGYAFSGSKTLLFEPLLMQSVPPASRPTIDIPPGKEPPPGAVLISLHRRMDFPFDNNSDFERPMVFKLIDEFGNPHRIRVHFKSPTERNELEFTPMN
jgi:hypothetical protein